METVDLVVVGAGWSGLCAAKTHCEVNSTSDIVILESAGSVGGVWVTQRLCPRLKSNNMIGTYEYPDFPMDEKYGVKPGQHMPGQVMYQYLDDYTRGNDVLQYIRFNSRVQTAERKSDDTWLLAVDVEGEDGSVKQT